MESRDRRQQYKAMMNQLKEKCLTPTVKICIPKWRVEKLKVSQACKNIVKDFVNY